MFYCLPLIALILIVQTTNANSLEVVLKLDPLKDTTLQKIEADYGLKFLSHLFQNFFIFEYTPTRRLKRSTEHDSNRLATLEAKLRNDSSIEWHEIQREIFRVKRSPIVSNSSRDLRKDFFLVMKPNFEFEEEVVYQLNEYIHHLKHFHGKTQRECKRTNLAINDPEWTNQWYMNDGCPQGNFCQNLSNSFFHKSYYNYVISF